MTTASPVLPISFEGRFSVYCYWQSHGLLLLRSFESARSPKRLEILFRDVLWMSIPAWLTGLTVEVSPVEPLLAHLPVALHREALLRRGFALRSEGATSYIVCGTVQTGEDNCGYFEPSALAHEVPTGRLTIVGGVRESR
jgi:hypothetical protein